jgi:chloramphenicol-sensitive protein RarD
MSDQTARGVSAGIIDCLLWAAAAMYWPLLGSSSDGEILGHRLVWAALCMVLAVIATGRVGSLLGLVRQRRKMLFLVGASLSISVNWAGFVWGVTHGRIVEASLGFFINPLMTVLLAVLVLREKVRPWQWVAIGLACLAVLVVTVDLGRLPWYALLLSVSGGSYGLFKKQADAGPYESLAVETAIVAPVGLVFLLVSAGAGHSTFVSLGAAHSLLLIGGGVVTVAPLLFYGYAATRVPLVTLGLIGYLAPLATFALGILYFGQTLEPARWAGFALIWFALVVFAVDAVRMISRRPAQATAGPLPLAGFRTRPE